MTTKPSRMVADRTAIAGTVLSALETHGPEIAPKLEAVLFPNGAPPLLTVADFIAAFANELNRRTEKLVEADQAHTIELSDDEEYRVQRAERIADLRSYIVSLRSSLTGNYSALVARAYGLAGPPPEDAAGLLRLAGNVETLLRNRPLTETPKKKSLAVDPILAADDMKASADALNAAIKDVEREKREAQLTLNIKSEAMSEWGSGYGAVADAAAAFFTLAGRTDLAERVRPTARRKAGLPESDEQAPAPEQPAEQATREEKT